MHCRNWAQGARPMPTLDQIATRALRALLPPARLRLSDWIEANIHLPEGVSAQTGSGAPVAVPARDCDAIGDPEIERVTLVKPVRVGFTTLLTCKANAVDPCSRGCGGCFRVSLYWRCCAVNTR